MSHGHKRIVCACGKVLMQCRCMGPKETETRSPCRCSVAYTHTKPEPEPDDSPMITALDRLLEMQGGPKRG